MRIAGHHRVFALVVCGAFAFGCDGSDPVAAIDATTASDASDAEVTSDGVVASDADVQRDADASDATAMDADAMGDGAADDADRDVLSDASDAGVDAPIDIPAFDAGPPGDVGPLDVSPVDSGPTVIRGHNATALVSAGAWMTAPEHRMVSTLGQSTIHQSVLRSSRYRLRGGLVGATGGTR